MKLFLHIGIEKTATTSTQRWFQRNRDQLLEQGIMYSEVLGPETHRKLCLWALNPGTADEGFQNHSIFSDEDKSEFQKKLVVDFAKEVGDAQKKGAHSFVISNEHLHSRLRTIEEVQRVYEFVAPHFSEINLLCFLRPQVDVAVSLTSTLSRDRWVVKPAFFDQVGPKNPYFNYLELVERWATAFGRERMVVLPYSKWPTAAQYLIDSLQIDVEDMQPIPRVNEAVDIQVMAMVNALNLRKGGGDLARNAFARVFLNRFECKEKISIGPKAARSIQARFDKNNAALISQYPELNAKDLEPNWKRYDRPPNLWKLEQSIPFRDALSELVRIFNEELLMQELQASVARAQRAIARRNVSRAQQFVAECREKIKQLKDARYVSGRLEAPQKAVGDMEKRMRGMVSGRKE